MAGFDLVDKSINQSLIVYGFGQTLIDFWIISGFNIVLSIKELFFDRAMDDCKI